MRKLLDIESRSRCHKASLVPLPILVSALTECARHELPLPVLWAAAPCCIAALTRSHPRATQVWPQRRDDRAADEHQAHATPLAARD